MKAKDSSLALSGLSVAPGGPTGVATLRSASLDLDLLQGTPSKGNKAQHQHQHQHQHHKRKDSDLLPVLDLGGGLPEPSRSRRLTVLFGSLLAAAALAAYLFQTQPSIFSDGVLQLFSPSLPQPAEDQQLPLPPQATASSAAASAAAAAAAEEEDRIRKENYRQEMRLRRSNEKEFTEQYRRCGSSDAAKVSLPQSLYPRAACMDGSRPAYYYRKGSGTNAHKWLVFFEGGGWCYSLEACRQRTRTDQGSSLLFPEVGVGRELGSWSEGEGQGLGLVEALARV